MHYVRIHLVMTIVYVNLTKKYSDVYWIRIYEIHFNKISREKIDVIGCLDLEKGYFSIISRSSIYVCMYVAVSIVYGIAINNTKNVYNRKIYFSIFKNKPFKVDAKDCVTWYNLVFKTKILIVEFLKHWHQYKQSKLSSNRKNRSNKSVTRLHF